MMDKLIIAILTLVGTFVCGNGYVVRKTTDVPVPKTDVGCPASVYNTSTTMTIYSPNYPNDYANNQQCLYEIIVPDGTVVRLQFTKLYTEYKYDMIEVFDGFITDNKCLGTFSGAEIPDMQQSSGNVMTVRFTSDPTYTYRGFSANYTAVAISNTTSGK